MKIKLEYIWLDGYKPEPNLRSKIKIVNFPDINHQTLLVSSIENWGFDGSSTEQAQGNFSDCYLKPIKVYAKQEIKPLDTVYVFCEVLDAKGNPHTSNHRSKLGIENEELWFGFEQEYFIRDGHKGPILGHDVTYRDPQGKYYCGVGGHILGRNISDIHLDMCLEYGLNIEGTNAEVALGQWEYQIFAKGKLNAGDDLWVSRYFLFKIAEQNGLQIELHPKPILGWNGSGLHTNFSNQKMRENGGKEYFEQIFKVFGQRLHQHIAVYGSDNDLRLTGQYETAPIDKFSWGISDRGASIRIPKAVAETWKGYLEDRRPASNADPYQIIYQICESLRIVDSNLKK